MDSLLEDACDVEPRCRGSGAIFHARLTLRADELLELADAVLYVAGHGPAAATEHPREGLPPRRLGTCQQVSNPPTSALLRT